jgi:hypothetical protein
MRLFKITYIILYFNFSEHCSTSEQSSKTPKKVVRKKIGTGSATSVADTIYMNKFREVLREAANLLVLLIA